MDSGLTQNGVSSLTLTMNYESRCCSPQMEWWEGWLRHLGAGQGGGWAEELFTFPLFVLQPDFAVLADIRPGDHDWRRHNEAK